MIRAVERWRNIEAAKFERCQMRAIGQELDQLYKAENGLAIRTPTITTPNKVIQRLSDSIEPAPTFLAGNGALTLFLYIYIILSHVILFYILF